MNRPQLTVSLLFAALSLGSAQIALAQAAAAPVEATQPAEADKQPKVGLRLDMKPLPTREEARRYAANWLKAAGVADGLRLGKLRALEGIYIADLMDAAGGKQLVNQLVMRKKDGYAVMIYPANLAAKAPAAAAESDATASPERKLAMMGMAAISGGSGVGGGTAVHGAGGVATSGDLLINSPQEAATAAKLWLYRNGLNTLKVAAVRNEGGIFVGGLVDKQSNAMRNQFIVRRADGFIAMTNPVVMPQVASASAVHGTVHSK